MDAPSSSALSLPSQPIDSLQSSLPSSNHTSPHATSKLLPLLPTEIKKEILRFCDQPTLAKTSSLSLAFLQLSSPLLYDEIKIVGFKVVKMLFCDRDSSHQPQLEPYLNLRRIRSLTFTPSNNEDPLFFVPLDRCQSVVVEVDSLVLRIPPSPAPSDPFQTSPSWRCLLPLFNLASAHFLAINPVGPGPGISLYRLVAWPNLSLLTLNGCDTSSIHNWGRLRTGTRGIEIRLFLAPEGPPSRSGTSSGSLMRILGGWRRSSFSQPRKSKAFEQRRRSRAFWRNVLSRVPIWIEGRLSSRTRS